MNDKAKKVSGGAEGAKRTCFVITPIGAALSAERKHADWVYHGAVVPACAAAGLEAPERADKIINTPMITAAIFKGIEEADICIADLTYLNPNVFYELGIRHAIEKPVIHIAQNGTVLPFDNGQHFTHFFDVGDYHSVELLRQHLERQFDVIRSDKFDLSNPLTQARGRKQLSQSVDDRDQVLASAVERLDAVERYLFRPQVTNVFAARNALAPPAPDPDIINPDLNLNVTLEMTLEFLTTRPDDHEVRIFADKIKSRVDRFDNSQLASFSITVSARKYGQLLLDALGFPF